MSVHQFSAFTSDIKKRPAILADLQQEAAARVHYKGNVTITEHGAVTTVTGEAA